MQRRSGKKMQMAQSEHYLRQFSSGEEDDSEVAGSEADKFEEEHDISQIYEPHKEKRQIVVSVIDTGIGIKRKDKIKLFKLFGCL